MKNDDELQGDGFQDDDGDMDDFDLDVEDVKKSDNFEGIVEQTTDVKWQGMEGGETHDMMQKEREEQAQIEVEAQAQRDARLAAQQHAAHEAHLTERLLNSSYYNLTLPQDSEKPIITKPPKASPQIPDYYPAKPQSGLLDPSLFSNFDVDVLFFVFYYQQDTYSQYLAARELKIRSWRYHKEQNAWFQRKEKPTEATDEYERGTYIYFDYKHNWSQKVKEDFKFEYRHLEDELQAPMPAKKRPAGSNPPPTTTGHAKYETAQDRPQMPVPTQR